MLGDLRSGCGDAGELLRTVAVITDGDDASWVAAWQALGDRVAAIADDAVTDHPVSARDAYLRAATYHAAVLEREVIRQITTPLLVTDPDGEQFWPGQSQVLYDALSGAEAARAVHR